MDLSSVTPSTCITFSSCTWSEMQNCSAFDPLLNVATKTGQQLFKNNGHNECTIHWAFRTIQAQLQTRTVPQTCIRYCFLQIQYPTTSPGYALHPRDLHCLDEHETAHYWWDRTDVWVAWPKLLLGSFGAVIRWVIKWVVATRHNYKTA